MSATTSTEPMSQEEYLAFHGLRCPNCRSSDTSFDGSASDDALGSMFQKVRCLDCGSHWTERYQLTEYDGLEPR